MVCFISRPESVWAGSIGTKSINHRQCWQSNDNWKGWTCGFYSIYSCKIIQIQHLQKWPGTFLPNLWLTKTNNWQFYTAMATQQTLWLSSCMKSVATFTITLQDDELQILCRDSIFWGKMLKVSNEWSKLLSNFDNILLVSGRDSFLLMPLVHIQLLFGPVIRQNSCSNLWFRLFKFNSIKI